jgi:hypothetical protein
MAMKLLIAFFTLFVLAPAVGQAASIRDLPRLSTQLTHHFECHLLVADKNDMKDADMRFDPQLAGHSTAETTLIFKSDQVVANVNSQTLEIKWARAGKPIASSMMMIQNSTTQAFVLIVRDPADDEIHADLNCTAIQYSDLPKGNSK